MNDETIYWKKNFTYKFEYKYLDKEKNYPAVGYELSALILFF